MTPGTTTTEAIDNTAQRTMHVGPADAAVSADPKMTIETDPLGSSIAVALFDPVAHVGGVLHFLLPRSPDEAVDNGQAMFADTGLPMLIERATALGATSENLVACAAGGAELLDEGRQGVADANRSMLEDVLRQNQVKIAAEDIGGTACRTLSLSISDGAAVVRNNGKERVLWQA